MKDKQTIEPIDPMLRAKLNAVVREFCKKHRICTRCRRNKPVRGLLECRACKDIKAGQDRGDYHQRRYQEADAAGLCVKCHKEPQQETNKRCSKCEKIHADQKVLRRKRNFSEVRQKSH